MSKATLFFLGLILGFCITLFWPKKNTNDFDMEKLKSKYESMIQAKVDSLELFKINKQRALAVADSQIKRYIVITPKLNENIDFMRLDTLKDSDLTLSRRDVAAISYMAIELEAYKKMADEFPVILKKETKQAYDKGKKDGIKKGALIGAGGTAFIVLILAIL